MLIKKIYVSNKVDSDGDIEIEVDGVTEFLNLSQVEKLAVHLQVILKENVESSRSVSASKINNYE